MIKGIRIALAVVALVVILFYSWFWGVFDFGGGVGLLTGAIGIPLAVAYAIKFFTKSRDTFWNSLIFLLLMAAAWIYMYVNLTFAG